MGSAKTVGSLASEGALLAQDLAAARVTDIFAQQHSLDLEGLASKEVSSLADATAPPGRASELEELLAIARRVTSDLHELATAKDDDLARLARDLENAATSSQRIGEATS